MFENIKLVRAFNDASKVIKMNDNKAFDTLKAILDSQGLDTNVKFTPQEAVPIKSPMPTSIVLNGIGIVMISVLFMSEYFYVPVLKEYEINTIDDKVYIDIELERNVGVKEVQVISNGKVITGEYKNGKYSFLMENNGDYEINVISNSGKINSNTVTVSQFDEQGPKIETCDVNGSIYTFVYSDENSIDYSSAYGLANGVKIIPKIEGNTLIYEYEGDSFNIFISDGLGNISEYLIEK